MLIIGYHVAKTGGTTIMHHMRDHLGEDAYYGYGNNGAMRDFFRGQPLWEELSADQRAPVKMIFGHGVRQNLLLGVKASEAGLFTSLREPFSHFVSRYNHRLKSLKLKGLSITPREFIEQQGDDAISKAIFKNFRKLCGGQAFDKDSVFAVLRQFQFLCTTEQLTQQTEQLCENFGIPPVTGRFRVAANKVGIGDVSAEEIYDRFPTDRAIHEELTAAGDVRRSGSLKYDETAFSESVTRINQRFSIEKEIKTAYARLADFLVVQGALDAARLELVFSGRDSDEKYDAIWAKRADLRAAPDAAQSEQTKAKVYQRHGKHDLAAACYDKANQLQPNFIGAISGSAQLQLAMGNKEKAKRQAEELLAINASHPVALKILEDPRVQAS